MDKLNLPVIGIPGRKCVTESQFEALFDGHVTNDALRFSEKDEQSGLYYVDIKADDNAPVAFYSPDNSLLDGTGAHLKGDVFSGLYLKSDTEPTRVYSATSPNYVYVSTITGSIFPDLIYYVGGFANGLHEGSNVGILYAIISYAALGLLFDEETPFLVNSQGIARWANAKFALSGDTEALKSRLDNLIKDAPEAYDTLKEIGDYIATHKNEYEALNALASKKVDKEAGKGLSTNDYTEAEKDKLAGVEQGATKTIVDAEIIDDSTNPVQNRVVAEIHRQVTQALREIGSMARDLYSHDTKDLPLLCGQPSILFGKGTPQADVVPVNWKQYDWNTDTGYDWNGQPSALGQQYINISATTGGRYIAIPNDDGSLSWKNF